MPKRKLELALRSSFILVTVVITAIGLLQLHAGEKDHLHRIAQQQKDAVAIMHTKTLPKDNGIGILTYISRNYRRWAAQAKRNPLKWMQLKQKLKRFLNASKEKSTNKLDTGKQKR